MSRIVEELDHPKLQRFYAYWDSKRRRGRLPSRRDIDPVEIPELLSGLLLLDVERVEGGYRFRFHLIGTDLIDMYRENFTGRWVDEALGAEKAAIITPTLIQVTETKEPHFWHNQVPLKGREHIRYARLICPLADDGRTVSMIAGMFVYQDPKAR